MEDKLFVKFAAEYQQMECNRKRKKQKQYPEPESGKKGIRSNKARVQLKEYDWYISRMEGEALDIKRKVYICGIRDWNKFKLLWESI